MRLAISEGELDEDSIDMLQSAAIKEGLDPDEVVSVAKKRLKQNIKTIPKKLSPYQELAETSASINSKFDSAILSEGGEWDI